MSDLPVLYSFRRCPYAMRARLALAASEQVCELREVVLRDKPAALLEASPKATVPVLIDLGGTVIDESLEIMLWALRRRDPSEWLTPQLTDLATMLTLIAECDGAFKANLDRYKYPDRYAGAMREAHRDAGATFLQALNSQLEAQDFLFGARASLADIAIAPFVRQFAHTDERWFATQRWPALIRWLEQFVESALYARIMHKYPPWRPGADVIRFPG
jgi:glutathione S-transferase